MQRTQQVSFWWKDILKLQMEFRSLVNAPLVLAIHSFYGMTIGLSPALKIDFLSFILFLARKSKGSIRHFLNGEINKIFSLPLSVQASNQLISLMELLKGRNWDLNINDKWTYTWNSKMFSVKKTYCLLQGTQEASPLFFLAMVFRQPWKTSVLLLALTQT
jgi:hypothetical protein